MIDILASNYTIFIVFAVVVTICSFLLFGATRRYKRKKERLYSVFMDMNRREAIIVAAAFLSLGLIIYYIAVPDNFTIFGACLVLMTEIFSFLLCFNFRIIFIDILSAVVSVVSLQLIALTRTYVSEVYDDGMITLLLILSTAALCVFALLMCVRKVEIILKRNKFIRRNDE